MSMIKVEIKFYADRCFTAGVSSEETQLTLSPSFIPDGLRDFLTATRLIASGVPEAVCRWEDEPGEYRWLLSCKNDIVMVKILEFPDYIDKQLNNSGTLIFEGQEEKLKFCARIKRQYDRLRYEHGLEEYKEIWGYDFPLEELERLEAAIQAM